MYCVQIYHNWFNTYFVYAERSTTVDVAASSLVEDTPLVPSSSIQPLIAIPRISQEIPIASTSRSEKRKHPLFKGIEGLSRAESTPRKRYLMDVVTKKEDHIRKLKRQCKQRGQDIKALQDLSESNVARTLFKGLSQETANFLIAQLRCGKRAPKGRRWSDAEKVVALAIYKRGPKCYNFLRKIVALPSRRTILALLEKVPLEVGINEHLFRYLNQSLHEKLIGCVSFCLMRWTYKLICIIIKVRTELLVMQISGAKTTDLKLPTRH